MESSALFATTRSIVIGTMTTVFAARRISLSAATTLNAHEEVRIDFHFFDHLDIHADLIVL